jgi:hypothetical protein
VSWADKFPEEESNEILFGHDREEPVMSLSHQTDSGTHPGSFPMAMGDFFSGDKRLTTFLLFLRAEFKNV